MSQIGCVDTLCLTFDFNNYPYTGPINSYFYEAIDFNIDNFWGQTPPIVGSFNPFSLGESVLRTFSNAGLETTVGNMTGN